MLSTAVALHNQTLTCQSHLAAPSPHQLRDEAQVVPAAAARALPSRLTAHSSKVMQQSSRRLQDQVCMQQSAAICTPA
jgi:hypothetical protein